MLYNTCTGIYKSGNNIYPHRIRRGSNLGHIFGGNKCVSRARKYGNQKAKAAGIRVYMLLGPPHLKEKYVVQGQIKAAESGVTKTISQVYRNVPQYNLLPQQSVIMQVKKNAFSLYEEFSPSKGTRIGLQSSMLCEPYYSYCGAPDGIAVKALRYKPAGRGFNS